MSSPRTTKAITNGRISRKRSTARSHAISLASLIKDGSFIFNVPKVSKMKNAVYATSKVKTIHDVKYQMSAAKVPLDAKNRHTLSFWVNCTPVKKDEIGTNWCCFADLEYRVLSKESSGKPAIAYSDTVVFNEKNKDFGWVDFHTWEELMSPSGGYIDKDTLRLEVIVRNQILFRTVKDCTLEVQEAVPQRRRLDDFASLLFNNTKLADVTFIVGEKTLPAHRFVLAAKSRAFENMLYITYKGEETITLSTKDVHPDAFVAVLRFFYRNELVVTPHLIKEIHRLARKWFLDVILKTTQIFICPDNFFDVLEYSQSDKDIQELTELEASCWSYLRLKTQKVLASEAFLTAKRFQVKKVIVSDDCVAPEYKIFYHVMNWGLRECERHGIPKYGENVRKCLDEVFFLIRFPLMTRKEFDNVKLAQVLRKEELDQLDAYFASSKKKEVYVPFPTQPRNTPLS